MKKLNTIIWGIVLVLLGVIWGLNATGITQIDIFFDGWWTLFIIVPCLVGLFTGGDKGGNVIGILVGVALLLASQDVLSFSLLWKLAVPVIIVLIGLKMIFQSFGSEKSRQIEQQVKEKNGKLQQHCATFAGVTADYTGEVFEGAELTAVFGGVKCDLRQAVISADAVLRVCAVFGGVTVLVPDGVNIKVTSNSIFGGMTNKKTNQKENAVTVYVTGSCIFGGADIQ